jgi:hypothetical protein
MNQRDISDQIRVSRRHGRRYIQASHAGNNVTAVRGILRRLVVCTRSSAGHTRLYLRNLKAALQPLPSSWSLWPNELHSMLVVLTHSWDECLDLEACLEVLRRKSLAAQTLIAAQ